MALLAIWTEKLTGGPILDCWFLMMFYLVLTFLFYDLLQILPLQTILDFSKHPDTQILKTLAMSVYTECRKQVTHSVTTKSLTGFGPVASTTEFTKADKVCSDHLNLLLLLF